MKTTNRGDRKLAMDHHYHQLTLTEMLKAQRDYFEYRSAKKSAAMLSPPYTVEDQDMDQDVHEIINIDLMEENDTIRVSG